MKGGFLSSSVPQRPQALKYKTLGLRKANADEIRPQSGTYSAASLGKAVGGHRGAATVPVASLPQLFLSCFQTEENKPRTPTKPHPAAQPQESAGPIRCAKCKRHVPKVDAEYYQCGNCNRDELQEAARRCYLDNFPLISAKRFCRDEAEFEAVCEERESDKPRAGQGP